LHELGAELRATRAAAAAAAARVGVHLAPLATSPLAVEPTLSPSPRYEAMARRFGLTASEELTCGCHVHVAIESAEEGVAALDRIRPWLAPLLGLSANSPFWQGTDSRYASYRSRVWARWPSAGPYAPFGGPEQYREVVAAMLASGTLLDEGMVYLDARLSRHHPTVEVRIADVCLDVDDAVLLASLVRALVQTAVDAWRAEEPPDSVRTELLRLASWRAARSGLEDALVDPTTWRPAPAAEVLDRLVGHIAPALEEAGELTAVRGLLAAVLARGNGARRQRAAWERTGDLAAVVRATTLHA
jgi:carboxylate-amine ligase